MAYVSLGYLCLQKQISLKEMIRFSRYTNYYTEIIEQTLKEEVDFDPLEVVESDQKELINCAVEVDNYIHKKLDHDE